jgi:hypothetical protein
VEWVEKNKAEIMKYIVEHNASSKDAVSAPSGWDTLPASTDALYVSNSMT